MFTAYAHLDEPSSLDYGAQVEEGGIVGNAGRTGNAEGVPVDQEHVRIYENK